MAPVIPIVASLAGSYAAGIGFGGALFGAGILGSFGQAIIADSIFGFAVSAAINQIGGRAFAAKPKTPSFSQSAVGQSIIVRSSIDSHKIVYGMAKVSGPLVFAHTVSSGPDSDGATVTGDNIFLHLVIALVGHEVESIDSLYLNDQLVSLDANGWVTASPYAQPKQTTTTTLTASISSLVRASGTATATTVASHGFSVGDSVNISQTIQNSFEGNFTILTTPTATTFTYANAGADATIIKGIAQVTHSSSGYKYYVRVNRHLGAATQTADANLIAETGGLWTAAHRLQGIAYLSVRLQYNPNVFPQGIPNISAIVKGKKLYDPRDSSTAWSDNWALCLRDYLASDYGFGCASTEIDDTFFIAAANISDEPVTLLSGGTQKRYTCDGVVDTAVAPLDNLDIMRSGGAGFIAYVQGKFRIFAAAYDSSSGALTDSILTGTRKVRTRTTRKELFNAVKGTFIDPNKSYQPTDFPAITNPTYQTQDGEQIFRDLELPFTQDPERAQRIAKILLEKSRQGIIVEMPVNYTALKNTVGDVITLTNSQLGWSAKQFRILKWQFSAQGAVNVTLQEESSASYDWAAGNATTIDPGPDTNLPNPFVVSPPGVPMVTESLYVTSDGTGVKTKATVTWAASTDSFVTSYQLEYKVHADTNYTVLPQTTSTTFDIVDIASGYFDFRVKALNNIGVSSSYATLTNKEIVGLGARPADITGLTGQAISSLFVLRWAAVPDVDVRIGGNILIRHSEATSSATWEASISIGDTIPGVSTIAILPLKQGTYLVKAEDSSGLQSTNATTVTTDGASVLTFSNLGTVQEDATFPGTNSGTAVDGSTLKLGGASNIDAIADFDSIANLDSAGGVASTGTYTFSAGIDNTTVQKVRLLTSIAVNTVNIIDLIDSRTASIDDWLDFDGSLGGGSADARIEVRSTNDDPAGSPTWSPWNTIHIGDYEARAFQFRCVLTSADPAFNIYVTRLRVTTMQVT